MVNRFYTCCTMVVMPDVQVTVAGNSPTAREGHAACIISSFLLISSGVHTSNTGSQRRLADTHILDLATPSWECVDDGAWAASVTFKQMLAQYCVFHGNKLYMLKPSKYALCKPCEIGSRWMHHD